MRACIHSGASSSVSGASGVTVVDYQPVTLSDANGNMWLVCAYQCANINSGGCNTAQQIEDYFVSYFGGRLRKHLTQYSAWSPLSSYKISQSVTSCCAAPAIDGLLLDLIVKLYSCDL